jgi:cob(I)alamin adenosyltransferase
MVTGVAVHLTRIYTRTGDDGTTALGDMTRVPKTDARVAAYADCDETNASIGVALATTELRADVRAVLAVVQNDLFDVGADLSTPVRPDPPHPPHPPHPPLRVEPSYIDRLENWCDEFNAALPKLDSFILPGGTPAAALLHRSRTIARRAERSAWVLYEADPEHTNKLAVRYLNRLSDLLFILARVANPEGDVKWRPGGDR